MTDYQENFIQKMRFYRKRAGITQTQLAELCGVSNGTIGNIECGITKPSFDLIIRLAEALKIQPSDFFDLSNTKQPLNESLSAKQYEIVRDTVNAAVNNAISKALSDLKNTKFEITH